MSKETNWRVAFLKEREKCKVMDTDALYLQKQINALQEQINDDKHLYLIHQEQCKKQRQRITKLNNQLEECKDYLRESIYLLRKHKMTKKQKSMVAYWFKKACVGWRACS
jgi:peptidoglycan hydrolase CwlO-like protein